MSQSPSTEPHVGHNLNDPLPNVRPLGYLAVGCGVLSILMALTFFLSLFAVPLGLLALGLGLAARTEDSTRTMGTISVALGLAALPLGTVFLYWFFTA